MTPELKHDERPLCAFAMECGSLSQDELGLCGCYVDNVPAVLSDDWFVHVCINGELTAV